MCDTDKPYQAQAAAPANQSGASMYAADGIVVNAVFSGELPEKIEINGVTYRREADWVDEQVNLIRCYQAIADCTGVSLRRAVWFRSGTFLPD